MDWRDETLDIASRVRRLVIKTQLEGLGKVLLELAGWAMDEEVREDAVRVISADYEANPESVIRETLVKLQALKAAGPATFEQEARRLILPLVMRQRVHGANNIHTAIMKVVFARTAEADRDGDAIAADLLQVQFGEPAENVLKAIEVLRLASKRDFGELAVACSEVTQILRPAREG